MEKSTARPHADYARVPALPALAAPTGIRAQTQIFPAASGIAASSPTLCRTVRDAVDFGSDGRIERQVVDEVAVADGTKRVTLLSVPSRRSTTKR